MRRRPEGTSWLAACLKAAILGALLAMGLAGQIGAQEAGPARQVDESGALLPRATADGVPAKAAPPAPQGAATEGVGLDFASWDNLGKRSERAISDNDSSSATLERLRWQLVDWRSALQGAQSANSARIATLRQQISALGPIPADGAEESPETAARRSQLNDQLLRLQAPAIAADEAYRRADGLIREIDRVLRERKADQLLQLWPMPINPANWPEGVRVLSGATLALWSETARLYQSPAARAGLADSLPVVLALVVLALAILWRGGVWFERGLGWLQRRAALPGRRILVSVASLGQIVVPLAGIVLLSTAALRTGLAGPRGQMLIDSLPGIGLSLFGALWLGGRIFGTQTTSPQPWHLRLAPDERQQGQFIAAAMGLLVGLETLRRVMFDPLKASEAALAVISFPVLVLAGLLLVRLGGLMRRHARTEAAEADVPGYTERIIAILARAAMFLGIAGPALAAFGYVQAGSAMVFPAILSLGLLACLYVLQQFVSDLYALLTRREAMDGKDGLVPVLIGFALALASLPLFALIWGARVADLSELWTRFGEGLQLGETRISPSVFLFFSVVFAIGYTLTRMLQGALKTSILPRTSLDQGGQNAIVSGVGYVGIILAALVAINSAGIDLSGLAIVAGALSVGIGFGLQNIVSNFVSGIILLIERPVSEGDWIEVGNVQGIVKSISVRSTRIQTFDRSDVIVPNLDLISGRVTNWTRFNLSGRLTVPVAVAFTSDTRLVERILREIVEAQPLAVLNPPPIVAMVGFGAETLNFEIRVILRDVNFSLAVRSEINHQITARFAAQGIYLSGAHRDFQKTQAECAAQAAPQPSPHTRKDPEGDH